MNSQAKAVPTDWVESTRLTVVVGHFGSGKTELSVNLAMELARRGHTTAIADLDIVDPYFRTRECKDILYRHGIQLISTSQACTDADVPAMPPEVTVLFDNQGLYGVLDIGGDASGARVLARYREKLLSNGARMLCVINANRPLTDTPEKAVAYIRSIEQATGFSMDGLIGNTHLFGQTELQDILTGRDILVEVSAITGIPVICHVASAELAEQFEQHVHPIFPIDLYMKKPWEQVPMERR